MLADVQQAYGLARPFQGAGNFETEHQSMLVREVCAAVQTGRLVDLGNVRMVGMTKDDLQDMFKLRFDDAGRKVWMLPQDVIDQTINAFSVSATSASG